MSSAYVHRVVEVAALASLVTSIIVQRMRDEDAHVSDASGATETSPLIGAEVPEANNGKAVKSNGTFADSASSSTAGDVADDAENGGAAPGPGDEVIREGLPEMAAKMHLLMPALGIGVSSYSTYVAACFSARCTNPLWTLAVPMCARSVASRGNICEDRK